MKFVKHEFGISNPVIYFEFLLNFSRENSYRTKIILERIFKAGGLERSKGHHPGGDDSFI